MRIERIVALPDEDGGDAPSRSLHGRQDAQLVVHHHVVPRRIPALDVVEHQFLVDVDQNVPVNGLRMPERSILFGWCGVAVGERSPAPGV
jgi:hypothetical protein